MTSWWNHSKTTINYFFDNVFNTLIKRFIKTKPNWNQYETFWKRYVFAGLWQGCQKEIGKRLPQMSPRSIRCVNTFWGNGLFHLQCTHPLWKTRGKYFSLQRSRPYVFQVNQLFFWDLSMTLCELSTKEDKILVEASSMWIHLKLMLPP